ncbi:MAG: gliding motility-associated C-terminal domain-containing protein [Lewinella sp.]|nr:gliding motility-associated C-terminal domain-containing protein [Lewinella sp.]
MRFLLTLLFISIFCTCGRAQGSEGTDFWFTFLEHRDPGNTKVALISARAATSGTITIPGTSFSQPFTVGANSVVQVSLPAGAETLGSEMVTSTAIHVESDGVISLYIHQYFGLRSEASLVLPTSVLGADYYVLAYSGRPGEVNYPSTFAVVASEDNTEVAITNLAAATEGGRAPQTAINVTLNQGEVYQVRAANGTADLTGTRVTTSAPVALFSGASWSGIPNIDCPAFDNLLEINYPISQWGTNYLGVPTLRNDANRYRVIAAENNTSVSLSGATTQTFSLNAGEFRDFEVGSALGIRSDKPVLVGEYLLGSACNGHPDFLGDPSFFLLNELTQTQDTVTVYNSNLQNITENFLNITFRAGDEVGIELDGAPLTVPVALSPDGEYAFARVQVNTGGHTITSSGCGVIVTVYGYGQAESYAYGGGAAFRNINANPIAEGGCLNDTIYFATGLDTLRFRHEWTLEDGTIDTRADFSRLYDQLGTFPVQLIVEDLCLGQLDTNFRELAISLRQALTASPDARVCEGELVALEAFDLAGARYEWSGPNGFMETTQQIALSAASPENTGVYEVIGNVEGCKTLPTEVRILVDPAPIITLAGGRDFCARQGGTSSLDAGEFAEYRWRTGALSNPLTIRSEGNYSVTVTDENGCMASDSAFVDEFCPTRFYVPSAFSPNGDGINDWFGVSAVDFTSVQLQVFNRWGGLVFESTEAALEWNGRVGEELAPSGTYLYKAVVEGVGDDGSARTRVQSGTVVLVR